jgi:nucleotide-binding universal stress UspA family protein
MMKALAYVDGSQWSVRALQYARDVLDQHDELVLLHVAPRGGEGYLETGRMVLEASTRAARLDRAVETAPRSVQLLLCIGDPKEWVPYVAEQEKVGVVLMGGVGVEDFPRVSAVSDTAQETVARTHCPVVVCSPRGVELLLKGYCLVTQPRSELARLGRARVVRSGVGAEQCEDLHRSSPADPSRSDPADTRERTVRMPVSCRILRSMASLA